MKLKTFVKAGDSRSGLCPWILERFPPGYEGMTYIEPFLGSGEVLLAKEKSVEEVVNSEPGIIGVWRAVRDEADLFSSKVKRIKCTEKTFALHSSRSDTGDYLCSAVSEFVLRNMSKGGGKKSFLKRGGWGSLPGIIKEAHERLSEVFMLDKDPMELLRAFNFEDALAYCDPPEVGDGPGEMPVKSHLDLGEILKSFKGKVVVVGPNSATYKRMYSEWTRKSVPGRPKESVWVNF